MFASSEFSYGYEGTYLLFASGVPNPHTGFPFVWIVSVNCASPLQKRTSQLWSVNRGPAGSSPVNPMDIPLQTFELHRHGNIVRKNMENAKL
jgi:hypothetical protein